MKRLFLSCLAIALAPVALFSQEQEGEPKTSDMAFLIGTWDITADHFNVSEPGAPARPERGSKVCEFALEIAGEASYITCENRSVYEGKQESVYVEYINYNPYAESFEKTNFFSGWPVKVIERVAFDEATRVVEIRGRTEVENEVTTYVEYWRFNEDYSAFDRQAWINLASMPMTEYRLIVSGKGVRAGE